MAKATGTFRRFPVEVLVAVIGTVAAMTVSYLDDTYDLTRTETRSFVQIVLSCVLVLNVALSLSIAREAQRISEIVRWALLLVIGGLLTWFVHTLNTTTWQLQMFLASALMVHAGVALSGAWNRSRRGFWEFNKTLFLRTLTGALFTGVLMLGMQLALVSLDALFEVTMHSWMHAWVVFVLVGVFNTLFVLGGIPSTPSRGEDVSATHDSAMLAESEVVPPYPRGLRIFTQFVLLPLVVVFLGILYAYGIKVLFFASLKGAVTAFILALAVVGILGYLLVYPLRKDPAHAWIALFARWFGRLMLPLCAMLWVAIWARVVPYGVTEERYIVMALGMCLTIVSCYLAIWRDPDLRVIPALLCVASLVSFVGPLNMAEVSYRSQTSRAERVLEAYGVLKDGRIDSTASTSLPDSATRVVSSTYYFLYDYEDSTRVKRWLASLGVTSPSQIGINGSYSSSRYTVESPETERLELDIDFTKSRRNAWVQSGTVQPFNISIGPDQHSTLTFYDGGTWYVTFPSGHELLWIVTDPEGNADTLSLKKYLVPTYSNKPRTVAQGEFEQSLDFPSHTVRFVFDDIDAFFADSAWTRQQANGLVIVEHKQ